MRGVIDHLRRGMENLGDATLSPPSPPCDGDGDGDGDGDDRRRRRSIICSARIAAQNYRQQREDGVNLVCKRLLSSTTTPIDTICFQPDGVSWENASLTDDAFALSHHSNCNNEREYKSSGETFNSSSGETVRFKQQYINHNIPCVIRGLDKSHFSFVTSQWRSAERQSIDDGSKIMQVEKVHQINTEWFRQFVGNDTMVPVRYTEICDDNELRNDGDEDGLDDDGRAQECKTKQMSLDEWISTCQNHQTRPLRDNFSSSDPKKNDTEPRIEWYLKDWHLLQFLANQDSYSATSPSPPLPLYTTPNIFERDILNRFLERCGSDRDEGGDYKFVYWGPAGSRTSLHSDVLHSFSWSYNVVGMKKWIFYVPPSFYNHTLRNNREEMKRYRFEVIQHAGETIFVPCTWKHEVVNLVETLSINHNWITSANVDQAWICLQTEISAIEEEIQAWGVIPTGDFEARENMLRGCIGLDCTMFTLMVMLEIVELLPHIHIVDGGHHSDDELWDCAYSMFRLGDVLVDVLRKEDLVERMAARVGSDSLAREVKSIGNDVIQIISKLNEYPD